MGNIIVLVCTVLMAGAIVFIAVFERKSSDKDTSDTKKDVAEKDKKDET